MPTLALRGSITSVPKWTVDIKEKRRGFVKTASCIFQVTDSVRVTCFVTDLSILTLLKNANVSPGMSVFVAGKRHSKVLLTENLSIEILNL